MLAALAAGIPLSIWGALYPQNTWLQVGPVIALASAGMGARRWPISNGQACGCAFLLLHLVGAVVLFLCALSAMGHRGYRRDAGHPSQYVRPAGISALVFWRRR
jgi:hypothetical protein